MLWKTRDRRSTGSRLKATSWDSRPGNLDLSGADWQVQVLAPATAYIDDGEYGIHARSGSLEVQGRARLVTRQLPDGELFLDFTRVPGDADA